MPTVNTYQTFNNLLYYFQSVVIVSRLPFINLFSKVCGVVAPEYFDNGVASIEAAFHDIDRWPSPVPGETINLPLLGTIIQVSSVKNLAY